MKDKINRTLLDKTRNSKWFLYAATRKSGCASKTTFELTNKIMLDFPVLHKIKSMWVVHYDHPEQIPKYVKVFINRYFKHWFYPMQIKT